MIYDRLSTFSACTVFNRRSLADREVAILLDLNRMIGFNVMSFSWAMYLRYWLNRMAFNILFSSASSARNSTTFFEYPSFITVSDHIDRRSCPYTFRTTHPDSS